MNAQFIVDRILNEDLLNELLSLRNPDQIYQIIVKTWNDVSRGLRYGITRERTYKSFLELANSKLARYRIKLVPERNYADNSFNTSSFDTVTGWITVSFNGDMRPVWPSIRTSLHHELIHKEQQRRAKRTLAAGYGKDYENYISNPYEVGAWAYAMYMDMRARNCSREDMSREIRGNLTSGAITPATAKRIAQYMYLEIDKREPEKVNGASRR